MTRSTETAGPGPSRTGRPRWRRRLTLVAVVVAVLILAGFVANSVTLDQYVLSPGVAQPVGPLISVSHGSGGASRPSPSADIYLTDVYLTRVRALEWPLYQLDPNDAVYATSQLFPSSPQPTQIQRQEALQMVFATEHARVAALRYLGYRVPRRQGAIILEVSPGSPASRVKGLGRGDAITAVDGVPTPSESRAVGLIRTHKPGQRVTLAIQHVDGAHTTASVVLGHLPHHPQVPFVGVGIVTGPYFQFPFQVGVNSDGIGGPSAGLAFTLGILNRLGGGDLTGGHRVAATGTISENGKVGLVGGVPQKTIAVRQAGATVFLVPPGNYHQALSKADGHLKVVPVSTLAQALAALRRMGAHIPPPSSAPR